MFQGVGPAGASAVVNAASGGKVYAYNNISNAAPSTVAQANPARTSIVFHNPGANDIFIGPLYVQNTGADVQLNPTTASLGGMFRVFANGGQLTITGECQKQWQALA